MNIQGFGSETRHSVLTKLAFRQNYKIVKQCRIILCLWIVNSILMRTQRLSISFGPAS